jgi:DNA-binding transcriptional ArsR family regulator
MHEVSIIEDPAAAEASLDPLRRQILADLVEPGSASTIAARLGIPRQKVNYHLRVLEQHGLVELVAERPRGNFTERMLQATSASYVISPGTLGRIQPDPSRAPDRLSARWLLALASRLVRDVGTLLTGAQQARRPVATFAIDGQIRFASAADRAAFTEELSAAVTELVAKHHTDQQPGTAGTGKLNRLIIALHPAVPDELASAASTTHVHPTEPATAASSGTTTPEPPTTELSISEPPADRPPEAGGSAAQHS